MRKSLLVLCVLAMSASHCCYGEARWCDVIGHSDSDKLLYPPIARAARVSGTLLVRIIYTPQGETKDVISISGPPILTKSVDEQLKAWHLKTDASGEELCQSLVIVDFHLDADDSPSPSPAQTAAGSIFRVYVEARVIVLSDPAATVTNIKKRRFLLF